MAERLTKQRIQALLDVARRGEDEMRAELQDNLEHMSDADGAELSREIDQTLVEYEAARRILYSRYLAPKATPHPTPEQHDRLPGFE